MSLIIKISLLFFLLGVLLVIKVNYLGELLYILKWKNEVLM